MTDRPLIDEVREALEYLLAVVHGEMCAEPLERCRNCVDERDLLARLDGMTIVPAGEVERLREAVAMTGTEAVNLRVRVIEERAIAAERERIKREVDGHGRSTGMGHKSADWQDGHEEMRAAVFRIIDGEATDG